MAEISSRAAAYQQNDAAADELSDNQAQPNINAGSNNKFGDEYMFKIPIVGDHNVGKTSLLRWYQHLNAVKMSGEGNNVDESVPDLNESGSAVFDGSMSGSAVRHRSSSFFRKRMAAAPKPDISGITPTIGIDFVSIVVPDLVQGVAVRAQFWDTAGMERYAAMNNVAYRNAAGAIIVFDLSDIETLESVEKKWLPAVLRAGIKEDAVLIIANKADLASPNDLNCSGKGLSASGLTREAKAILSRITHKHRVSALHASALTGYHVGKSLDLLLKKVLGQVMGDFGDDAPPELYNTGTGYCRPSVMASGTFSAGQAASGAFEFQTSQVFSVPPHDMAAEEKEGTQRERKSSFEQLSNFTAFQSATYSPAHNDISPKQQQQQQQLSRSSSEVPAPTIKQSRGIKLVSQQEQQRRKSVTADEVPKQKEEKKSCCPC